MQHLHFREKVPLFFFLSIFFGQVSFAQIDPPPPLMHDQEVVEEVKGVAEPATFVIPQHWKTGKPQAGRTKDKRSGYVLNDSILIPFEYEELDITYSDFMIAKREECGARLTKKARPFCPLYM